ncbi:MAG: glycosyltransferase 87 family protein, partial [Sphingomonas sp.]|nr:glycosyltransferase 87 family protein [Sphingomonas sp.]
MGALLFVALLGWLSLATGAWPATVLAIVLVMAGITWLGLLPVIARRAQSARILRVLILIGLAARLALLPSPPLYEDDYVRYLWDGGITAAGLNPYARTPAAVLNDIHPLFPQMSDAVRPASPEAALGAQSKGVLERVSYPSVTTIYPPLAQLGFAAAHLVSPWSLLAWKVVGLAVEALTLWLLIGGLRSAGRSPGWAMLYWLCPLVIKDFANGAHMDVLLMPALAGVIWAMLAGRLRTAAVLIGVAAALKFWPLLLVPGLAWRVRRWPDRIALAALALFSAALLLAPQLLALDPASSGLSAYAESWVRNSLVFPALQSIVTALAIGGDPALLTRLLVAAIVGGLALRWGRRSANAPPTATIAAWRDTVLALLLLSPTGYSWYATWLVPFLAFAPEAT